MSDTDVISEDGKYPYICAISTKNGVKGYSNITLSTTADSSATVFYQPFPFIGRQQIAGILLSLLRSILMRQTFVSHIFNSVII